MIDWNKPIETVDGRAARLVEANIEKLQHIVYVYGKSDDVFLVDPEGYRCDDRAIYSKRQEPFIRNARVKREGWILIGPPINGPSLLSRIVVTKHIYPSEQEALRSREELQYTTSVGTKAVFFQWEE